MTDQPLRNIKITVEYDGAAYEGWQFQPRGATLQALLEKHLAVLLKEKVRVMGAGRTDSGVHALAQVASFRTTSNFEPSALRKSLNAILPRDVGILSVEDMPPAFDARRSSIGKHYRYQVWNAPQRSVFHDRFSWHIRKPLDFAAMRSAAAALVGRHDFTSFRASNCEARHAERVVHRIDFDESAAPLIMMHAEATAFLKNMVRTIAGTLVEVGQGKRDADSMPALLAARDRQKAGKNAPAQGLFLVHVYYP